MSAAKPVSLYVRPFRVSHLCFEVGGILESAPVPLGATVTAFDFPGFYNTLEAVPTVAGDLSRLLYNSVAIDAAVASFSLGALRSEARKTALNNAINARQNAYFSKYANAPAIIAMMNQFYSPSAANSKPQRLNALSSLADDQFTSLQTAYSADGRLGVVKNTSSLLTSTTSSSGNSSGQSGGSSSETGSVAGESITAPVNLPHLLDTLPGGGGSLAGWGFTGGGTNPSEDFQEQTSGSTSQSSGTESSQSYGYAVQRQNIVNTDYGYRTPYLEGSAQLQRAQISLMDQQFAQFMYGQNLPNLAQVFQNELNSIDGNVYRLQIAYLNNILMSPIAGTVTGLYKNPGDAVKAGEPVARVEDNSTIYLVATVIYRGPVVIGSTVTVQTSLFDSASAPVTLTGSVVSARGHRNDDQWDLVVQCNNLDSSGNAIFPLGYRFDYDDTQVSIT